MKVEEERAVFLILLKVFFPKWLNYVIKIKKKKEM